MTVEHVHLVELTLGPKVFRVVVSTSDELKTGLYWFANPFWRERPVELRTLNILRVPYPCRGVYGLPGLGFSQRVRNRVVFAWNRRDPWTSR